MAAMDCLVLKAKPDLKVREFLKRKLIKRLGNPGLQGYVGQKGSAGDLGYPGRMGNEGDPGI
jgi:hypothetical protein